MSKNHFKQLLFMYFSRINAPRIFRGLLDGREKPISEKHSGIKVSFVFTDKGEGEIHYITYREVPVKTRDGEISLRRKSNPPQVLSTVRLDGEDIVLTDGEGRVFRENHTVTHENPEEPVTVLVNPVGWALVFRYGRLVVPDAWPRVVHYGSIPTEMEKSIICNEYLPKDQQFPYRDKLYLLGDVADRVWEQLAHGYTSYMSVSHTGEVTFADYSMGFASISCPTNDVIRITSTGGGWFRSGSVEYHYTVGEWVNVRITGDDAANMVRRLILDLKWVAGCRDKLVIIHTPDGISYWKNGNDITSLVREHIGEVDSFTEEQMMILALLL